MNLNTVEKNFNNVDDFKLMLEKNKPISINKAIDILGYIIAKDKEEYVDLLFHAIDDAETKAVVFEAVNRINDTGFKGKQTVKKIVGTSDQIMNLIIGDSDDELSVTSSSSSSSEDDWESSDEDEFSFKIE